MSATRRLTRALDHDLIERIEANGPIKKPIKVKKDRLATGVGRAAGSYRGARRNAARGFVWKTAVAARTYTMFSYSIELNRSDRSPRATTYAYAREISSSSSPVR
jgi:hypothetical protein